MGGDAESVAEGRGGDGETPAVDGWAISVCDWGVSA